MYFKIVQIDDVMKDRLNGIENWDELKTEVRFTGFIQSREHAKYAIIDVETAEKFGLESEVSMKEFFDQMDYYDEEELDPNNIKNCIIVKLQTLEDKRIPELASEIAYNKNISYAYRKIASFW